MFGILYALIVVVTGGALGFLPYAILASFMLFVQYMIGPKLVEWSMKIKYVSKEEMPELHEIVEELARKAKMPKPRVCISRTQVPNAFAFGRTTGDARVCVTQGILGLMNREELKAVLGHEISHIKHRDVMVITLLSVVPMICWYLAWNTLFFGGGRRDRGNTILIGIAAFALYFITNLLVLYASRIREYYADLGSVKLGNSPHLLASALYKLVYGSARMPREALKQVEGYKAFFLNDPSRAITEVKELRELDLDKSGEIDQDELTSLVNKKIELSQAEKLMELFSTHPNMLKRIKHLSSLSLT
jgi:heat shock protein HtpX